MPERRPSPVRAWTWPQILKRSRTRWPILSRISAKSPPVCRCRMMAVAKNLRSRLGTRLVRSFEGFLQRDAEVLFFERAAEFAADRVGHFLGDQAEAGRQAVAGAEGAGDQLERFGQLGGKLSQPSLAPQQAAT